MKEINLDSYVDDIKNSIWIKSKTADDFYVRLPEIAKMFSKNYLFYVMKDIGEKEKGDFLYFFHDSGITCVQTEKNFVLKSWTKKYQSIETVEFTSKENDNLEISVKFTDEREFTLKQNKGISHDESVASKERIKKILEKLI